MASKSYQPAVEADNATAAHISLREVIDNYELLVRAIDHAHLWHELAWDGPQAAEDARRDVERARRALEVARDRAGG